MKIEWNKVTWYSKLLALALFVALPFIGFYYGVQYNKDKTAAAGATAMSPVHQDNFGADYKNLTYIIDGRAVTLKDGQAEMAAAPGSASKIITDYFGDVAVGDLNNDGATDTAFLLTQNTGGSSTFYYAVAALSAPQGFIGTNGVFLGDRIAPQTTEIRNNVLIVNYADRKPNEAMTMAPSVGRSKYLVFDGKELTETPIVVNSPEKDSQISSPLTVTGQARGNWYFEASFPMILTDWDGRIIVQGQARAQSDWTTTDYVPFAGALTFDKSVYGTRGFLILKKDNPSGLPQNDASMEIPIYFK